MRTLLRHRLFRRLLGGWTVGNLADSALFLTLAVWAKDLTGSSSAAGLVFFALALPSLLAPLLGLLVDRVRRKPLIVSANLVAAGGAASLVLVDGPGMLWLLYAVTLLYGGLGVLNGAAQSGLLRDLLPDDQLDSANAMLSTVDNGLRILTPAIGAGLYVLWGGQALGLGVAALLLLTAALIASVPVVESDPDRETSTFWADAVAGFAHLRSVPLLLRMVIVVAAAFGVIGLFDTVLFEVVEHGLGMDPAFFGVLMSLQGAGAILGGLTSALVLRRWGPARTVGTSLAVVALASLAFTVDVVGVPLLPVVIAAILVAGAAIPWLMVAMITTRQRLTPPRLQGRTAAATNISMTLPQLVSIAAGAVLVTVVDYRVLLVVAAVVLGTCAIVLLRFRGEEPPVSDGAAEPSEAADLPR
ncbi:MFS transporter [Ruania alba]|uniref:Predicted arabinose efflux permease, MFS family n=1 Tax=Ruania alba TaxID=648782 RepID=A0A1H5N1T5_9MICO|nr:MFS transporter [Ruania alba]SEE94618.1 Predicted arabinose efflux permease, MFS family [Ruania alba]